MTEGSKEYNDLVNRLNIKDSFREINKTDPGFTSEPSLNSNVDEDDPKERLYYIFYKPGKEYDIKVENSELTHTAPVNGMYVSDHFGVHSKFKIEKK